ncbi:hypothetical protein [Streptomyces sp. NPDC050564]|uniref:hypothetical protein n=1 Tax=Streptomyces sp. NPDC050564 TaxID=3365631 RepID=UPI0037A600DA
MGDIAKGVFGGFWTLLTGWILPTAVNLAIFALTVLPSLRGISYLANFADTISARGPVMLLVSAVLFGWVLNALQNPLYRIIEGYLLWPRGLAAWRARRQIILRDNLKDKVLLYRLQHKNENAPLMPLELADLRRLLAISTTTLVGPSSIIKRGLLIERLNRYPVDSEQIAPTRLGNAIRRFEVYGHDRFQLDSQVLWSELTAAAPEPLRRQVDVARASVDFFVAMFWGHSAVAATAIAAQFIGSPHRLSLSVTAVVLIAVIPLWYRSAVTATDEWDSAVRALVNLGRVPLAAAFGLALPQQLSEERDMWKMVTRFVRVRYHERATMLDRYRAPNEPPSI